MESWILVLLSLTLTLSLPFLLSKLNPKAPSLPPGPSTIAFFAKNIIFKKKSLFELEQVIHDLHKTYGPIMSLRTPSHPNIFIEDREIAHQALVQLGSAIADRPPLKEPMIYLTCNGHDINTSPHGPLWRLLRRNLTSEMLHPSSVKKFAPARSWAFKLLVSKLNARGGEEEEEEEEEDRENEVIPVKKFSFTMFCLLVAMCFGQKLDEEEIEEIRDIQYSLLFLFVRFNLFAVLPRVMKVLFRRKWNQIVGIRRRQAEIFNPLIRARKERKLKGDKGEFLPYCYVDSLLDLEIPEEGGRKLSEDEIVNLCHEFLSGGTETTSAGLEWIMAEIVKHQEVQRKLAEEIERVIPANEEIKEEDLQKMPYLKAVVVEGLRRHPPAHFILPHRAARDVKLNNYLIPKGSEIHTNVVQLGWDEKVWEDPMEFKPERFIKGNGDFSDEVVDITGSREIKMMPFGAGRRICPGYGLAMLHLEYFVANLVRKFEWRTAEGQEVDLTEGFEITTVMKNPLRAQIFHRGNK
ncbi:uncharacterized protein A4U43_C01F14210 [Asparagus officinalis]|uniref:Cytochrome P450 n=1 Tax=Asparagus officinalis TaxID=4686 RepID=A0A5P1FTX0_ASPOF|nr:cytochrome P450 89A2-like [Asparagus officinalis]ONK80130.1 uncharacterized protein A4U43_C01F14210 [Asparagus officinalis]